MPVRPGTAGIGRLRAASVRERVYQLLEPEAGEHGLDRAVTLGLAWLVILNVAAVVLETLPWLHARWSTAFSAFEVFSVAVFTLEYVLRLWSCRANPRYRGIQGHLRYLVSPGALIDLVAILPSLIPGGTLDLRFARSLRLLRLARSLKLVRYSRSLQTMGTVLRSKREDLTVAASIGAILLVAASSAMYYAEHEAHPEVFSSIPAALWWGVVTLTTVGYGDVYPLTTAGKVLGGIVAVLGIGLFALPAGILASGFAEEVQQRNTHRRGPKCPHCGAALDRRDG